MAVLISDRWKNRRSANVGNDFYLRATLSGCWCSDVKLTPSRETNCEPLQELSLRTCLEKVGTKISRRSNP